MSGSSFEGVWSILNQSNKVKSTHLWVELKSSLLVRHLCFGQCVHLGFYFLNNKNRRKSDFMSSVLTRDIKTMILFYGRQHFIDNEFPLISQGIMWAPISFPRMWSFCSGLKVTAPPDKVSKSSAEQIGRETGRRYATKQLTLRVTAFPVELRFSGARALFAVRSLWKITDNLLSYVSFGHVVAACIEGHYLQRRTISACVVDITGYD